MQDVHVKLNAGYPGTGGIQQEENSFVQHIGLKFKEETVKYIWSIALCDAGTWTLREIGQKYLESYEIRCRSRMEKIIWTNRVENEEV
jgi:hypothetical protein